MFNNFLNKCCKDEIKLGLGENSMNFILIFNVIIALSMCLINKDLGSDVFRFSLPSLDQGQHAHVSGVLCSFICLLMVAFAFIIIILDSLCVCVRIMKTVQSLESHF